MADVTMTVYDATRLVASAPNWTDNKTSATSGNNYYIPNNGRVLLLAMAATTASLTIATPNTVDALAISDLVNALGDTDIRAFGPFPPNVYNDSQGRVLATVDANASLFAVRIP